MRAARFHELGGPDVLTIEEDVERPQPDKNEVVVEIKAASLNPVDILYREGSYQPSSLPLTPGSDFAGVVDAVGPNVDRFDVGMRVIGDGINKNSGYQGSFAEYAAAPTDQVAALPDGVDYTEAAALGHAGLTAWHALLDFGDLQLGDTCLIHGGTGGVGHIAVQLATEAGATVITTVGDDGKRGWIQDHGADHVLDYGRDDLEAAISAIAAPDVILDHMLGEYAELDIAVAATGGIVIGIEGRDVRFRNAQTARGKNLGIYQIAASSPPNFSGILRTLVELVAENRVTVNVAREFALEEAADAHRFAEDTSYIGKIIVTP